MPSRQDDQPTKVTLQRIGLASFAKWQTFGFFILGIFAGIVYTTSFAITGQISGIVIVWYFLLTPLMYAIVGLISSLILGVIYNSTAARIGGVEFDIAPKHFPAPPRPPERWEGNLPRIPDENIGGDDGA